MRRCLVAFVLLLPAFAAAAQTFTPSQHDEIVHILRDALKTDPSLLRDALLAMQADDDRAREHAMSDAIAAMGKQLDDPADAVEGNPAGDVTMVEFYDTRCPYCRRMLPVLSELLQAEPGLKLVMKDLPILGPNSTLESRALLAAQRQDGYFKLRDALMAGNAPTTQVSLRETANRLGLNGDKLLVAMDDPAIKARLDGNIALAQKIGVQGTPAMIVGQRVIAGAAELAELRQAVAEARHTR